MIANTLNLKIIWMDNHNEQEHFSQIMHVLKNKIKHLVVISYGFQNYLSAINNLFSSDCF